MPTVYTDDIYNGKKVSFEQFVLGCARAFGACVTMRDEPLDTPIPDEFKPYQGYFCDLSAKAAKAVAAARGMSFKDATDEAFKEYQRELKSYKRACQKSEAMRKRYEAMLTQVKAWSPPTKEHDGLKSFMVEQLENSMRTDCYIPDRPVPLSGSAYKMKLIEEGERDVEYYKKEAKGEELRARGRSAWVRDLRNSLRPRVASK